MEDLTRVRPLGCDFELDAPSRNREWYEVRGYEPHSTALFRTVAADADVVLDIGAHVGYYTLLARQATPTATVVAVEASPPNAEVLRRNVEGLVGDPVRVVAAAFAAASGTVTVQLTEASDNSGISGHPNSPTVQGIEVPAVTGDDLDLPDGDKLVVKLDVEGHELAALDGLARTFARFADVRLLVEMNPKCLQVAGSTGDDLIERLHSFGFRVFVLDEGQRSSRELAAGDRWADLVDPAGYANLYCVPAERCTVVGAVLHSAGLGGAERSHVEMVETLVRTGAMVHTVVPQPDLGLRSNLLGVGGTVGEVPPMAWWTVWPDEDDVDHTAWSTRELFHAATAEALAWLRPDVVLTQSGVLPQGALAAAALGIPHVWYLREYIDLDHGLVVPGAPGEFARMVLSLSDRVVTNSVGVARHLLGDDATVATVLSPVPRTEATTPRVTDRADRPWTVGVIGSLNAGKGQEDAIRAVHLLREGGQDVRLALIGSGTPAEKERVEAVVAELGLGDAVHLPGAVDDQSALYAALDCVAVTSRHEAYGRVPFEASAAGLPVVYARVGGPAEYLEDGVTALGYEPGDVQGLAAAFRTLLDDPGVGARLVGAARADLLGPERQERCEAAIVALVRDAAGAPVPPGRLLLGAVGRTAREAGMWRREAASAQATCRRVLSEHEELVERFHALEKDHGELVTGHLGYVAAHEQLVRDADDRVEQLVARHRGELDVAAEELAASRQANAALRAEVGDLRERAAATRLETADLRARVAEAEHALSLVTGSRTWRLRSRLARALRGSAR